MAAGRSLGLTVESLRHHLSVHDGDVDQQQQDHKEVVQEAQQAEQSLRQDVQRRRQVGDGSHEAQEDPDPEHPEESAHREHLPEGVAEQRGDVSESVHQLGGGAGERRGGAGEEGAGQERRGEGTFGWFLQKSSWLCGCAGSCLGGLTDLG